MGWKGTIFSILAAATAVGSPTAFAETQEFASPLMRGVRLDWCKHFGRDCGKPAADLFCKESGFDQAARFVIEENVGARGVATLVFGDGRLCEGPTCSGFRAIMCARADQPTAPVLKPPTIALQPAPAPPAIALKPPAITLQPLPTPPTITALPTPPTIAVVPLPVPPPPRLRPPVQATLPQPPSSGAPISAGGVNPVMVMPGGASLARCLRSDCEFAVDFNFDIDPNAASQSEYFVGNVEKIDLANGFVWQIATMPFPPQGSGDDLKPSGLIASGEEPGKSRGFPVDFKKLITGRGQPAPSLYVRILPIAQPGSKAVVGQPSNVIGVYYASVPPPQPPVRIYDASPPRLFSVKVVSFTPPDFQNPNRWGCVVIKGYKAPLVGLAGDIWKDAYPIGGEVCPPSFKGGSGQITSFGEFVDWATGGVTDAFDWVSEAYEDLKQLAVDIVMKYTPFGMQCELIGEMIDDDAPGYCELAANIAVNAGLAALGIPPSIPNYNELIDKGIDHAVELAAAEITTQTGVPCIGPCEDALRAGFSEAADELKKSSYTPGCVGAEEAHQHGREPLCLPDIIIAKPAGGAIYTPPVAVVEVTRLYADKNPGSIFDQKCWLSVGINFENQFAAQTVSGPTPSDSKNVPAQKVAGSLYEGDGFELSPAMAKGTRTVNTIVFAEPRKFIFPWTMQLWSRSQIPARDEQGPMGPDWFTLYSGAIAKVSASVNCADKGDTLAYQLPQL